MRLARQAICLESPIGTLNMPGPSLSLDVNQDGEAYVVTLSGDIDASSIRDFQAAIEPLCNRPSPRVILDCSALNYVNSAGLGLLFAMSRLCTAQNGQLILCGVRPKVRNVITVLGLEHLLALRETREDACGTSTEEQA